MIVSVGLVVENSLNIVPLKIGGIEDNDEIFDLAVIYTKTQVSQVLALPLCSEKQLSKVLDCSYFRMKKHASLGQQN
jgi:hypothetical protein